MRLKAFHGTRLSSAEAILKHGFNPAGVADQIEAISRRHGVAIDDLLAHMKRTYRFAHLDPRPDAVSVVGDPDVAGGWANRSPEAAREALMSTFRLLHPDPDDDFGWQAETQFWVIAQQNYADPPAVVTVEAAADAFGRTQGREDTAEDLLIHMSTAGEEDGFTERFSHTPEWRCNPKDLIALSVHRVSVRVDRAVLTYMAAGSAEAINAEIRDGLWGEPGGYETDGMPWWRFAEIWKRLSATRRDELEAIAALPLDEVN